VIDEAQSLSVELLEEVRLLANIESATEKLLPLVLSGQPELGVRLNDPALRQLKQRVALRCEITALELHETAAYIASRIKTAGGEASRLFTREAVVLIHKFSGGIPRTISVMCDNALLGGMALGRRPVDREIVSEVCRDFDLRGEASTDAETHDMGPVSGRTTGLVAAEVVAMDGDADAQEPIEEVPPKRFFFRSSKR
jgi:general secretion pathway protein A